MVDFKGILKEQLSQNREILNSIDVDNLNDLIHELDFIRNNEGTIYIAGNGGSASTASHFMNDLCKSTRSSNKLNSFRAVSLSDNISLLTAISNDIDYDQIFRYQLEIFLDENDALFIISASGNSRNLIEAVDYCNSRGIKSFGLLGFDGGELKSKLTKFLLIPTEIGEYGLSENSHLTICHLITHCLSKNS